MIKIDLAAPLNDALWERWRRDCANARLTPKQVLEARKRPEIGNLYKRKSIKERFYFSGSGPFRGKCAYCETYVTHFQSPDLDHFRPKLGVTDEEDVPITVDYGWGSTDHWGYFWLAYEWENLLPTCGKCNQASKIEGEKIGKHNRFPVAGSHAKFDDEVEIEQPLLLDPTHDEPDQHLRINTDDGTIEAKDGSLQGEMTIRVLGLNIRDQLRERRLGKIREVKSMLVAIVHDPSRRRSVLDELLRMRRGEGEYTAAVRAILRELAPGLKEVIDEV
jgi:hypothetical protein